MGYLEDLGLRTAAIGSQFNIPRVTFGGLLPQGLGAAISGQSQPYQLGTAVPGFYDPSSQSLGTSEATKRYALMSAFQKKQPSDGTTGGGETKQPQPQGYQRPGNAPPYDPSFNGQTVNYGGGQWRAVNGRWEWEGSNEERSAQAAQARATQEAEINDIYNPLFGILSSQEKSLQEQQPGEEKAVQVAYERGLEGVTGQEAEAKTQLGKQTTTLEQQRQNAIAQARQLYSELSQQVASKFGGRSSVAPFATELLGRQTTQQFGNIGTTAEQGRQAVADETSRLTRWVDTQKNEWARKKDEAIRTVQNNFQQQLAQINAQRGQLESNKARERAQALTDAKNRQYAIEQADRTFSQQLALFQAQKQAELTTTPQYNVADVTAAARQALTQPYAAPTMTQTQATAQSPQFASATSVGTRRGDYVFDGRQWVYSPFG